MTIERTQSESRGRFAAELDGVKAGLMTYSIVGPHKIIIDHTEVEPEMQGKKVGYQLVHAAVEYARTNDIKIIPLCPFAKAVFNKKEEYKDVLA
ncbi:MAG: GNAT family N-acetyltransferase [bacterium]